MHKKIKTNIILIFLLLAFMLLGYWSYKDFSLFLIIIDKFLPNEEGFSFWISLIGSTSLIFSSLIFLSNLPNSNKYLGKNKTKYIIYKSYSYNILKSTFFKLNFMFCFFIPIIINFIEFDVFFLPKDIFIDILKIIYFYSMLFYICVLLCSLFTLLNALLERTISFKIKKSVENDIENNYRKDFYDIVQSEYLSEIFYNSAVNILLNDFIRNGEHNNIYNIYKLGNPFNNTILSKKKIDTMVYKQYFFYRWKYMKKLYKNNILEKGEVANLFCFDINSLLNYFETSVEILYIFKNTNNYCNAYNDLINLFDCLTLNDYKEIDLNKLFDNENKKVLKKFAIESLSKTIISELNDEDNGMTKDDFSRLLYDISVKSPIFSDIYLQILIYFFRDDKFYMISKFESILEVVYSSLSFEEKLFFHMLLIMDFDIYNGYNKNIEIKKYICIQKLYEKTNKKIEIHNINELSKKLNDIICSLSDNNIIYITHRYNQEVFEWMLAFLGKKIKLIHLEEINKFNTRIKINNLLIWLLSVDKKTDFEYEDFLNGIKEDRKGLRFSNFISYCTQIYEKDYRFLFISDLNNNAFTLLNKKCCRLMSIHLKNYCSYFENQNFEFYCIFQNVNFIRSGEMCNIFAKKEQYINQSLLDFSLINYSYEKMNDEAKSLLKNRLITLQNDAYILNKNWIENMKRLYCTYRMYTDKNFDIEKEEYINEFENLILYLVKDLLEYHLLR